MTKSSNASANSDENRYMAWTVGVIILGGTIQQREETHLISPIEQALS
jgi:hypothetical protein